MISKVVSGFPPATTGYATSAEDREKNLGEMRTRYPITSHTGKTVIDNDEFFSLTPIKLCWMLPLYCIGLLFLEDTCESESRLV